MIHDIVWEIAPSNALQGNGCPECHSERIKERKTRSHKKYLELLSKKNPFIIPLEKYIDCKTPIKHKCLIHNVDWYPIPDNLLKGCGCPECSKDKISLKNKKSNETYIKSIKGRNFMALGEYKNASTPILHKCLIDGYEWYASPANILSGTGCPKCGGTLKKTQEEYETQVRSINPYVEPVGEYISARTPLLHRCKKCNHIWNVTPYSILAGTGCPNCKKSKGEIKISEFLTSENITYVSQKTFNNCRDKLPLPFDFYLPDYNICIEYDGEQHFRSVEFFGGEEKFEELKKHDNIKNNYCKENGIDLLRIPYYEYNNIENNISNFLFI